MFRAEYQSLREFLAPKPANEQAARAEAHSRLAELDRLFFPEEPHG